MRKRLFLFWLALCLGCSGCMHLYYRPGDTDRRSLAASWNEQAKVAQPDPVAYSERELEVQSRYVIKEIEIAATTNGAMAAEKIVLDYYQARAEEKSPLILVLPISGGEYGLEHHFARYFARRGFAVAIAHRAKIADRVPDLAAIDLWLKQTVTDNQRVLDWSEERPEIDTNRLAVFGVSMGAVKGVLLTAADARIRASVLGLVGGDIPHILTYSTEPGVIKRRKLFMSEHHMTAGQFEDALRKVITFEPNTAAAHIDPDKVLLVLGAFDHVVPFKKGRELRRFMGRPETIIVPTGHYSALIYIPYIQIQSLRFLQEHLGMGS